MCSHEFVNLVIRELRRFAPEGSEPNAGAVNYICQDKIKNFQTNILSQAFGLFPMSE